MLKDSLQKMLIKFKRNCVAPQLETQIEQITESEDESDKVKFYALVNEYAEIVKKVTLKHASKEIISQHRESRGLPTGGQKKLET